MMNSGIKPFIPNRRINIQDLVPVRQERTTAKKQKKLVETLAKPKNKAPTSIKQGK